jgi:hypothetical protein
VYFTAIKKTNQTITQDGDDAGKVTVHTSGTPDGEVAGEEMAVIAVDTRGLVFGGGKRLFAIKVTDKTGALLPRTINVTLEIKTRKTGAALFDETQDEDGGETLTRVDLGDASLATAQAALEYADRNIKANAKILVRVEKNEENMHRMVLTFNNRPNITLRLQGDENGPYVLKQGNTASVYYNSSSEAFNSPIADWQTSTFTGFINVGSTIEVTPNPGKTFILGSKVTLAGLGNQSYDNASNVFELVRVYPGSTFVMEKGSLITDFFDDVNSNKRVITVVSESNANKDTTKHGKLRIEGGSITNCTTYAGNELLSVPPAYLIRFTTRTANWGAGAFYKAPDIDPIVAGNTDNILWIGTYASGTAYDLGEITGELSVPE